MSESGKSRAPILDTQAATLPAESFGATRLRPGPGLAPDLVSADQRRRLLEAIVELTATSGFHGVTVRALAQRAGVSTRAFYRQFAGTADCLGLASEIGLLGGLERMEDAQAGSQTRTDAVGAAVASFMREVADAPEVAVVALVESAAGGRSVQRRVEITLGTYEQAFAGVLADSPGYVAFGDRLSRGVLGGMLRIAKKTAIAGEAQQLPELAPALCGWILRLAEPPPSSAIGLNGDPGVPPFRRSSDHLTSEVETPASVADERTRVLRACLRIASEDGPHAMTGPRIRRVAEVSRRRFDVYFDDATECFLESLEWLGRTAVNRAWEWAEGSPDPRLRAQRFLRALCVQIARNGVLSRLLLVDMPRMGREGALRQEQILAAAASGLHHVRASPSSEGVVEEASVAALWEIARVEVAAERANNLPQNMALFERLISR